MQHFDIAYLINRQAQLPHEQLQMFLISISSSLFHRSNDHIKVMEGDVKKLNQIINKNEETIRGNSFLSFEKFI